MSANVLLREDLTIPRALAVPARVGLLGCGVVGSAVARILLDEDGVVSAAGSPLELTRVAVRHPTKARPVALPSGIVCGDAWAVVDDPDVDVIVEVIGGVDLPRRLIGRALRNGKSVVTANKEVIALHGRQLAAASRDAGVDLLFEGAVGGAVPIVSILRHRLSSLVTERVGGVVNGTTNFVLERMATDRISQAEAVAEAQRLGYAETDPSADLDGSDAAAKLAILASLAFGGWITAPSVDRCGITSVSVEDLLVARAVGYEVKLVALAERRDDSVGLAVGPALVPRSSTLAGLKGVTNEITVVCRRAGPLSLRGHGAGGDATASAVVNDLVTAVTNRLAGALAPLPAATATEPLASEARRSRFFVRVEVGSSPDEAARVETISRRVMTIETTGCLPVGDVFHVGMTTAPVSKAPIEKLQRELHILGFPTGTPLPIAEV